jgi:REP element-mobilizing transposase RayT
MSQLTVVNDNVDLSIATQTARGRYWCNLHLVLVVDKHTRIGSFEVLTGIRDTFLRIAANRCHAISRLAVMPDHLHATLRAPPESSPIDLVYCYQNNLAYLERLGRVWSSGYYVGTFGDYSMQAIRKHTRML